LWKAGHMKYADKEIQELEEFFKTADLPSTIELFKGCTIVDVPAFIYSHLAIIKLRKGVPLFDVFYDRLVLVKNKILAPEAVA
jgi:hypothetical protein